MNDYLGADTMQYFRRGLACTLGLTKVLIDGGQPHWKQVKCEFNLYPLYEENDMMCT